MTRTVILTFTVAVELGDDDLTAIPPIIREAATALVDRCDEDGFREDYTTDRGEHVSILMHRAIHKEKAR